MSDCDAENENQQWNWGYVNETAASHSFKTDPYNENFKSLE
jgi:hypothetical protein